MDEKARKEIVALQGELNSLRQREKEIEDRINKILWEIQDQCLHDPIWIDNLYGNISEWRATKGDTVCLICAKCGKVLKYAEWDGITKLRHATIQDCLPFNKIFIRDFDVKSLREYN